LNKENVDNHEIRALIMGYVIGNPGVYYSKIKSDLGLKNGTFDHHIHVLLRERRIKKRTDGIKVRFFPFSFNIGDMDTYTEVTNKEQAYLLYLRQKEIATVRELAKYFSTTKQNVYPAIKNLKRKELIFYTGDGWISRQAITLTDRGRQEIDRFIKKREGNLDR